MRRRSLLATAGFVLLAGCGQGPGTGQDTTDGETTATTTTPPGTTTTGQQTTETAQTETLSEPQPTEQTTQTETATETETETSTPSQAERTATDRIETARGHLSDALDAYLAFLDAEDPSLLDVDASVRVTVSNVSNPVSQARSALNEVPQGANDHQQDTVDKLRGVAAFLNQGIRCQAELYDAYDEFQFVVERIYNENLAGVPDDIGRIRQEKDRASDFLDTLEADSDSSDVSAFEGISGSVYNRKVEQYGAEIDALTTLADAMTDFREGMDAFGDAVDAYEGRDYRDARELFPTADEEFGVASDTLSSMDTPESVADTVSELADVTRVLSNGSRDMARASRAGFEGRAGDRNDAFEAAEEDFQSNEIVVGRIDSVEELLD
jgi:hypothetical protein